MVCENNLIRLREIRDKDIDDNVNFEGIDDVSLATIDRVLLSQKMRMKQVYRVPFERNSARQDLRYEYVQRILQFDAMARPHEYLFLDEAGFNLHKRRQRGRNIIGQRAITEVPGQQGGNITLCAAMGLEGLVHRQAVLGSYNTQHLLTFLEELKDILLDRQQHHPGPEHPIYVIIWDNVHFQTTNQISEWFTTNSNHFLNVCLPPYSPFLNPIEEFFSSWRWKVYDRQPYTRAVVPKKSQVSDENDERKRLQKSLTWLKVQYDTERGETRGEIVHRLQSFGLQSTEGGGAGASRHGASNGFLKG
ncbi:uncharacterized protein LOC119781817 [Cyprinodon tularosa]|uniref:uncharacterized protein LOC119781817 n=1 Tax=Cyprinodon tularosa TaxID=77115 RepID=UPI0018E27E17|nr:uncharacterized protein LOC119781817 [Cyprinodon tularosa]